MKKISLSKIVGVHPETAGMELELDLAPIKLPCQELISTELLEFVNFTNPLIVVGEEEYRCVGRTALYRWMAAHMPDTRPVFCLVLGKSYPKQSIRKIFIAERIMGPALSQITPQQVKILYEYVSKDKDIWPNNYRSHANFSKMLGIKPIKGIKPNGERQDEKQ